jgi:hypothetical protein
VLRLEEGQSKGSGFWWGSGDREEEEEFLAQEQAALAISSKSLSGRLVHACYAQTSTSPPAGRLTDNLG